MSDNVDLVRIGDVVNYVIELTNSGSSTGSVKVTDTLPTKQLNPGSWVCTASGGASCGTAGGSGNLSDTATLPHGGKVDYVYTATVVSANTSGEVSNTVSGSMTSGGNQAQTNLSASDADIVVVFANNFEGDATQAAMAVTGSGGGASVSLELGVDAGLLNKVTVAPVTVASGQSASGKTLFSVQLMRIGADIAMRTLTTLDDGPFSDVSEWKVVDLKQHLINLGWRSASATGDDGFLSVGSSSTQMPLVANNSRENLTRLQVATENDIPWVVPVEP
jgi:uncharacterized repeat protein (TIGR01451 family)